MAKEILCRNDRSVIEVFGSESKKFTFGNRPKSRTEITAGPGTYKVQCSFTRPKSPSATIAEAKRPDIFTGFKDYYAAPGSYNPRKTFGSDTRSSVFSQGKRTFTKMNGATRNYVGPGKYETEKAITVTKPRPSVTNIAPP
jgi:hypothetical protein